MRAEIKAFAKSRSLRENYFRLGNVLTVVSDRKIAVDDNNDNIVDYYLTDIVSSTDYFCFSASCLQKRRF